jgi:hypothetical protein
VNSYSRGRHGRFAPPHAPPRRSAACARHEKQLLLRCGGCIMPSEVITEFIIPLMWPSALHATARAETMPLFMLLWSLHGLSNEREPAGRAGWVDADFGRPATHSAQFNCVSLCPPGMYFGKRYINDAFVCFVSFFCSSRWVFKCSGWENAFFFNFFDVL